MANYKRHRCKRIVKCSICTPGRVGNHPATKQQKVNKELDIEQKFQEVFGKFERVIQ